MEWLNPGDIKIFDADMIASMAQNDFHSCTRYYIAHLAHQAPSGIYDKIDTMMEKCSFQGYAVRVNHWVYFELIDDALMWRLKCW